MKTKIYVLVRISKLFQNKNVAGVTEDKEVATSWAERESRHYRYAYEQHSVIDKVDAAWLNPCLSCLCVDVCEDGVGWERE